MYGGRNSNNLSCIKRTYFFVAAMIALLMVAIFRLVDYQILECDKFAKLSRSSNKLTQVFPAARGDIVDRNGVLLATSSLNLNLIIDSSFPMATQKEIESDPETTKRKNQQGNQIICNLIRILENNNLEYDKNFPISKTAPHVFLEDRKTEETKLKNALNQQPYATANDTLNLLVEKFDIKGYNEQETVKIAAIRANMLTSDFSRTKIFNVVEAIEPEYVEKFVGTKTDLQGVNVIETSQRQYPCEDVAPHIVGIVGPISAEEMEKLKNEGYKGDEKIGKFGIEKKYEQYLKPKNGILTVEKQKNNKIKKYFEKGEKPQPGNTIRLTIDYEFQKRVQKELENFMNNTSSSRKGAACVVLDAKTGEVLAAISLPSYNLNSYFDDYEKLANSPLRPLVNKAFNEIYRPGSAIKPFIAAAGILSGKISTSTTFKCVNGTFPRMGCLQQQKYRHASKTIDMLTALELSCNNYFYNVAQKMGIETIDEFAPYFGLATNTGLEIYNVDGRVTNPNDYAKRGTQYQIGFTLQTAIGQADTNLTQLQMANCQSVIANKGTRLEPHIVKSIEKFDGSEKVFETTPKILSQLDPNSPAWQTVIEGMRRMAKSRSELAKLNIATKSGSPEYSDVNKKKTNATGVGIFPADLQPLANNAEEEATTTPKQLAMSVIVLDGARAETFFRKVVDIFEDLKKERAAQQ